MKNFTKLLMSLALLATTACVQDATEDLTPTLSGSVNGGGEVRSLQIGLPIPTRTELGEKVDGKYPVYWSESDVLAVNGEPTSKITINEDDKSVAVFDMPLTTSIPYNILYPYSEGLVIDTESGMYPVQFASEQKHVEGSFAMDSAPMFAWSDGFGDVKMHHLSTVLRFTIKAKEGEEVDLKYISVSSVAAESISGVFDVYCGSSDENDPRVGELVAREGASSSVFYKFENDSHLLTSTPQDFYIVVPKGEYAGFEVNIVAQDGSVCVRTFDATNDKKLLPGRVREFPEVEFEANSKMFLISNDVEMLAFARTIKNDASAFSENYTGALLIADVELPEGTVWEPIENYNSLFEGRGYTIKGLTTPLFGENVTATISNVNVESNVVESKNGHVGLIARSVAVGGEVFNCSAKGSLEYANPNITISDELDLINVGGLVGGVYGGKVTHSHSEVNVVVTAVGPTNASGKYLPCIGGVIGYQGALNDVAPSVVDNSSAGSVVWSDNSGGVKIEPFIGGVVGYVAAGEFQDNTNDSDLVINKPMSELDWGGVAGASAVSIARCSNTGSLTIDKGIDVAYIGGVLGRLEGSANKSSIEDCNNYGSLLFGENFEVKTSCNIGGVISYAEVGTKNVKSCDNNGDITYRGKCVYNSNVTSSNRNGNGNASMRIGGVVGLCCSELLYDCNNQTSGEITILGSIAGVGSNTDSKVLSSIAGVVATRYGKQSNYGCEAPVRTEKCSNNGKLTCSYIYCGYPVISASSCIGLIDSDVVVDCHNGKDGTFLFETSVATGNNPARPVVTTTARVAIYVAGLISYLYSECDLISDCTNSGEIVFDNAEAININLSGILGGANVGVVVNMERCYNEGVVRAGQNAKCHMIYIGGIVASTGDYGSVVFDDCYNSGLVEAKSYAYEASYIGGFASRAKNSNSSDGKMNKVSNHGNVVFDGESENAVYIGGYCGSYEDTNHAVQFENTGEISFKYANSSSMKEIYIGGFAGSVMVNTNKGNDKTEAEFNIVNKGNIFVDGYADNIYAAGCMGYIESKYKVSGLSNSGSVTITQNVEAMEYPTNIYESGVLGKAKFSAPYSSSQTASYSIALEDCTNSGDIIYKGIARDGAYVGGVVASAKCTPVLNCVNNGTVKSEGQAGDWASRLSESDENSRRYVNFLKHDLTIGGVIGETDSDAIGCKNEGVVEHNCLENPLKIDQWGKTASSRFDLGGVIGRVFTTSKDQKYVNFVSLTNEKKGEITIYGSPNATTHSSSIDMPSGKFQSNDIDDNDRANSMLYMRVNTGGVIGRLMDNSGTVDDACAKFYVTNCKNNADIILPQATRARNFNLGGIVGDILVSNGYFDNLNNSGKLTMKGVGLGVSTATTTCYESYLVNIGGVAGLCFDLRWVSASSAGRITKTQEVFFNNCTNDGDIYFEEAACSMFQTAGGILAQVLHYAGNRGVEASANVYYTDLDIRFDNCHNVGNIQYKSSAMTITHNNSYGGGIVGSVGNTTSNTAQCFAALDCTIRNCTNRGSVQFDRNSGYSSPNASDANSAVGGIVGMYTGGIGYAYPANYEQLSRKKLPDVYRLKIESCENSGRIWGHSGNLGGIIGMGYWFVEITGTDDKPTKNIGDIVVTRDSSGRVLTTGQYGAKVFYAGGIAGTLEEYATDTRHLGYYNYQYEGYPRYELGSQYVRVDHAVNEGAVGAVGGAAGGIVGRYRSLRYASAELYPDVAYKGGIDQCRNTGEVYSLEGSISDVGAIIGYARMVNISQYSTSSSYYTTYPDAALVAAKPWPVGVSNCEVGGFVLRGASVRLTPTASTYQNCIYGENWKEGTYVSVVADKPYDGCVLYQPKTDDNTGGDNSGDNSGDNGSNNGGDNNGENSGEEPTVRR